MRKKVGVVFSKELQGNTPLSHIGSKLPVYLRFLDMLNESGWDTYVLTRRTYEGNGIFGGGWFYKDGKFLLTKKKLKIDLVYDRTGGIDFPPNDTKLNIVNPREFKVLAWDKWATYQEIGKYMPATFLVNSESDIRTSVSKAKTDMVVLKPFNGLKGLGVFIGGKSDAVNFKFPEKFKKYIMQEFVDTSGGIPQIADGRHDLRVAVVNGKAVWCHVRTPKDGNLIANAAQGGSVKEVSYEVVPVAVKKIVDEISEIFSKKYGNTIYSIDFGVGPDGVAKVFEINDQIGFPRIEMSTKDNFLKGLVENFKDKLA